MYQYLDRPPVTGDVVEFQLDNRPNLPKGSIRIVSSHNTQGIYIETVHCGIWIYGKGANNWKVIATKPGSEAQPGDTIIFTKRHQDNFLVLCKQPEQPALSQSTPPTQETTMNIQQLLTALFGAEKPTTDYDRRPAFLVVAYDRDGSQIGTATADSVDAVKEKVANTPELWGCKVLTYSLDQEVTVKVPVKASKAKLAVVAPAPITTSEDE